MKRASSKAITRAMASSSSRRARRTRFTIQTPKPITPKTQKVVRRFGRMHGYRVRVERRGSARCVQGNVVRPEQAIQLALQVSASQHHREVIATVTGLNHCVRRYLIRAGRPDPRSVTNELTIRPCSRS